MKYAIISDIHSNIEAFSAVLNKLENLAVDQIICLGDIVGYGPNPNECVEIIRENNITCIIGNHDRAACGMTDPENFNPSAKEAILWTKNTINQANSEFLRNLPSTKQYDNFLAVHGAISDPDKYLFNVSDTEEEFPLLARQKIGFFGHTHIQTYFTYSDGVITQSKNSEVVIKEPLKYLINPGSVGQPRDRDPRASFLVYEVHNNIQKLSYQRVDYDIGATRKKILETGLNPSLAERLSYGY